MPVSRPDICGSRSSGSRPANPITRKYRSEDYRSEDVFESAVSAAAGFRAVPQRLRLAGKPARLIVAGIGVTSRKIFRSPTCFLRQAVFPVAFHGDGFDGFAAEFEPRRARDVAGRFIRRQTEPELFAKPTTRHPERRSSHLAPRRGNSATPRQYSSIRSM